MSASDKPRWNVFAATVFYGLTMACATMALCVAVIVMAPAAGPALWAAVPISLAAGMAVIHRRLPDYSYPIGVLFVPIVGALLLLAAMQVSWSVLGDVL